MITACTQHCSNGCSLVVDQHDEKVRIRGNSEHPFTRGLICRRTAAYQAHRTRGDRLTTAIFHDKVTGRRVPISLDEAYDRIAQKIISLQATPEAILPMYGNASFGVLATPSKYLFDRLGTSAATGSLCLGAGIAAMKTDFGAVRAPSLNDLQASRGIINFGHNTRSQGIHVGREVSLAIARGATVLTVSPGDFDGGKAMGTHCVIRPGTDRFFVAAVLRLLYDEDRFDQAALDRTVNADAFVECVQSIDIADCLARCDLDMASVRLAADIYTNGPTATILGRGLQRYVRGGETIRFIDALSMVTGNIGCRGGGMHYVQPLAGQLGPGFPRVEKQSARRIRKALLTEDLTTADPPVKMVWVEGTNPVTQGQDSQAVAQALTERFTVVVDAFMTDTAQCADIVLPCALMLEVEDIVKSSNHECVNYAAKVFDPPGDARSNYDIGRRLFERVFPEEAFPEAETILDTALARGKTGCRLAELKCKGFAAIPPLDPPFAERFDHSDGLARLPDVLHKDAHDIQAQDGMLGLASYIQTRYMLSQIPPEAQVGLPDVFVSPENPILECIDVDKPVELVTDTGCVHARLRPRAGLHRDIVWFPRGGWVQFDRCVNALVSERLTDIGDQAAFYEQRVVVRQSTVD
ncbi:molybdopterin-dependent oxidoreductase [Desulfovibrio inopinatus]|uniref:molybdopterin-dependent oxidoreductase n=1 Tax=Desulfovibrio inopinatus TaxID=102109 RepID=UPI00040FDD90|nr:molybdopterin-dependent oxidoreductase [Desulfovibrio inopinatus]